MIAIVENTCWEIYDLIIFCTTRSHDPGALRRKTKREHKKEEPTPSGVSTAQDHFCIFT